MFTSSQRVGLGLRQEFIDQLIKAPKETIQFLEIAPENWMTKGGAHRERLLKARELYPFIAHGLSLSIGGPAPLDIEFLKALKSFYDQLEIEVYSEHLSFSSVKEGNLFELMPLPFTHQTAKYVAKRITVVEDILERPLILENPTYYLSLSNELSEIEFIKAVLEYSGAKLLLDVNNVYVNSNNHGTSAKAFIDSFNRDEISYLHIAGHAKKDELIIDTHGNGVSSNVWQLLEYVYQTKGPIPTLLERDNNVPKLRVLLQEIEKIHQTLPERECLVD